MGKKITIYDLAEDLNVSPSTVSRSLNDHPSISIKTKNKVVKRALYLGYQTNSFALNLSRQRSNTIGVIVPRLNSNFMSTVLSGIEKVTSEAGFNLIISQSFESMKKEIRNAKTLYESGVDALLVSLASDTVEFDHFEPFIRSKIPLIFFDRIHQMPMSSGIKIDNVQAGFDATEHLILQGCRNILHISGNLKQRVYAHRYKGFINALRSHDVEHKELNILETELNPKNIAEVISHIKSMPQPIDGIFVANDTYAAHCIKALEEDQFRVPADIKVIGFNNDPISKLVCPTLSTIDYPGYEMGILAGESIVNHLNGNVNLKVAHSISLRHKLVIRESSKNNLI